MKFNYQFERKDFEEYLKDSNKKYNYACLLIFTVFYFIACFDLLTTNTLALLLSYVISVLILFSILKLVATIFIRVVVKRNDKIMEFAYGTYKVELTDTSIKEEIDGKHFEVAYKDIYHITKTSKYIVIYPKKEKIMYLFIKKLFSKEETYTKCVEMILKQYETAKGTKEKIEEVTTESSEKKESKETKTTQAKTTQAKTSVAQKPKKKKTSQNTTKKEPSKKKTEKKAK
jgi:membrane protein implicated in regulation of membrane protease activity